MQKQLRKGSVKRELCSRQDRNIEEQLSSGLSSSSTTLGLALGVRMAPLIAISPCPLGITLHKTVVVVIWSRM